MASKSSSQAQQETSTTERQAGWKKAADEQVGHFEAFLDEIGRLQERNVERANSAIDECAKLSHATVGYMAELGEQWRRLALTATRNATRAFDRV